MYLDVICKRAWKNVACEHFLGGSAKGRDEDLCQGYRRFDVPALTLASYTNVTVEYCLERTGEEQSGNGTIGGSPYCLSALQMWRQIPPLLQCRVLENDIPVCSKYRSSSIGLRLVQPCHRMPGPWQSLACRSAQLTVWAWCP